MSRTAARRPMYGITRVDHDRSRTHAWRVTIQRQGKIHVGHFSDGVYGGKQKALAAARRFRDQLVAKHPPLSRREYCSILRRNNRSGLAGVSFHTEVIDTERGPIERRFWIARLPLEPWRTKLAKFSVAKYGPEEAFRRAVKARKAALARLAGNFDPGAARP
jgi:AP2 domain